MAMQSTLTDAPTLFWRGVSYKTILSSAASGGAMSIVRSVSSPGSGPPRHIHHQEDETFVILTGRCEFWLAEKYHPSEAAKPSSFRAAQSTRFRYALQMIASTS